MYVYIVRKRVYNLYRYMHILSHTQKLNEYIDMTQSLFLLICRFVGHSQATTHWYSSTALNRNRTPNDKVTE